MEVREDVEHTSPPVHNLPQVCELPTILLIGFRTPSDTLNTIRERERQ